MAAPWIVILIEQSVSFEHLCREDEDVASGDTQSPAQFLLAWPQCQHSGTSSLVNSYIMISILTMEYGMKNLLLALVLCTGTSVFAQTQDSPWRAYVGGGFASGGELIYGGEIQVRGTTRLIPYELRPGSGIPFRIGSEYRLESGLALRASLGRAVTDPHGDNGSLTLTTTSAELLALYKVLGGLRIGGGLRQSFADLKGTGVAEGQWKFSVSPGAVVEAQYVLTRDGVTGNARNAEFGIALRAVKETFKDEFEKTFNGDHYEIGFVLNF